MDYTNKTYKVMGFVLPTFILYAVFCLYPMVVSLYYSMLDWNGGPTQRFILFDNFVTMFQDRSFFLSLRNSLYAAGYGIFIKLPIAMFLAVVMSHRLTKISNFFRFTYFLPAILSSASIALMWQFIYDPNYGLLSQFLNSIGLGSLIIQSGWLGDYNKAIFFALIPKIWSSVGWNFVLYSAGIGSISNELYEAAEIDGAGFFRKTFGITLPLMRDVIIISMILDLAGSLQNFDMIYILTKGGPANSTHVMATYMHQEAFKYQKMGYGSAIAFMIFLLSMVYTLVLKIATRKSITD